MIDPIDGTHTYALKMPDYAISVGVMKNCRPYLGCICLPSLGELLYFDGEKIHWLQNIYEETCSDTIIEKSELPALSIIFGNEWFVKINDFYNPRQDTIMSHYACVVHFYYMITKRAKAYYFGSYLWDIAGAWPMLQALGFEFYEYKTARTIEMFNPHNFNSKLRIKALAIACQEKDFDYLKKITDLREDKIS